MPNTNTPSQNTPAILLQPLKSALIIGHDQRVLVLVRVQAPDADPAPAKVRPPYHLALVIDRSGSMSGEPLHEAKRCAGYIVDQLRPDDRASLVQFDNQVKLLVPAEPVGNRKALHQALNAIQEGGMTNLHGGWEAGATSLAEHVRQAGLSRVILLSDGNANEGITSAGEIAAECTRLADLGVTTSTYGLGRDFNEELMVAMAKGGQGNHYYSETAKDLFEPFAEEFDLIANLYARQVRLSLGTPEGIQGTLLNDYVVEEQRGFPIIRMPDLAWGAEAWALVELKVPAPLDGTDTLLLQVEVTGVDLDGKPVAFPPTLLKLPAIPPGAWEALLPDPLVQQRANELAAARLLDQARTAAMRGDWKAIEAMLEDAGNRFADNPWVQEVLANMLALAREQDQARFSKEALFSSRRMGNRLSAKEELASPLMDLAAPSFLRRKSAQGKAQFRPGPEDGDPAGGS